MLAAARKHKPRGAGEHAAAQHAAPRRGQKDIVDAGRLGKIGLVEIYSYYPAARAQSA